MWDLVCSGEGGEGGVKKKEGGDGGQWVSNEGQHLRMFQHLKAIIGGGGGAGFIHEACSVH